MISEAWTIVDFTSADTCACSSQVLVKLKALSLNARDLQIATNTYPAPHPIPEPLVPVSGECLLRPILWVVRG